MDFKKVGIAVEPNEEGDLKIFLCADGVPEQECTGVILNAVAYFLKDTGIVAVDGKIISVITEDNVEESLEMLKTLTDVFVDKKPNTLQ